jgi:hypothetical protein
MLLWLAISLCLAELVRLQQQQQQAVSVMRLLHVDSRTYNFLCSKLVAVVF